MASIHWFRKGLRVTHDNPAFSAACCQSTAVYPVFIIDPWFANPDLVGINRYSFLLESLEDLDKNLRAMGNRLFVLRGKPEEELLRYVDKWNIKYVTFEYDTEPYAIQRDNAVKISLENRGVKVTSFASHTLHDIKLYTGALNGKTCNNYGAFGKLFSSLKSKIRSLENSVSDVPKPPKEHIDDRGFTVPSLSEMGYIGKVTKLLKGGETEALKRLKETVTDREQWVSKFEKPETSPNAIEPSTTVLSPYLKFGCLSSLYFYYQLQGIYEKRIKMGPVTEPPVSLHGQLLWREFFYFQSVITPNFDKMEGNLQCKQIPWNQNEKILNLFKNAQTGYPYIDAIMTQLRDEGWIHHLARHSVACFLTRGDLWLSWEDGVKVFDSFLLDSDWALNNANWQWLSCSNYFYQYWRCYSPVVFGKKTDPDGEYIKKYLPNLAKYPKQYIYEPWKAPLHVQKECGCIIGLDYPDRIVIHETASKENMEKMKAVFTLTDNDDNSNIKTTNNTNNKSSSSSSGSTYKEKYLSNESTGAKISNKKQKTISILNDSTSSKNNTIDNFFHKK